MRLRTLVVVVVLLAFPLVAEDLQTRAHAAADAGRLKEAFGLYLEALQQTTADSPDEYSIREAVMKLAPRLDPAPAVPEEAERYATRAQLAFAEAREKADFVRSAEEMRKAVRAAPWWPPVAFNLALVEAKLGHYDSAIANMKLYLLSDPPDAAAARSKLYEFEYRNESVATLVLYRRNATLIGAFSKMTLILDDVRLAYLPDGTYIRVKVAPGSHTLEWKLENEKVDGQPVTFDVHAKETKYIYLPYGFGDTTPQMVSAEEGRKRIRRLRAIAVADVIDRSNLLP